MKIRLSPSTLNLYNECPRCFWLHINKKVQRPRGIFPSLPSGMDLAIKQYFDEYRTQHILPPEIKNYVEGILLPDQGLLDTWRNWRTGLSYTDKSLDASLSGALDDCLLDGNFYIPLDYKTRGSAPEAGSSKQYYGNQLNCYCLLLEANGYKAKNHAYLVYYYPRKVKNQGIVEFDINVTKIETSASAGKETFVNAIKLLEGPIPKINHTCEYCGWVAKRLDYDASKFPKDLFG